MKRSILGAVCGAVLGAAIAMPIYNVIIFTEVTEIRRGLPEREWKDASVFVGYRSALLHFAVSAAGFGGVIGSVVGATWAIVDALKRGQKQSPPWLVESSPRS
jgi:hypothetical protein